MSASTPSGRNELGQSRSLYLRQHAANPVAWKPWGRAAFDEARRRDVPVFLSVGYSSCYWCHVMERETFEDPAVAAVVNDRMVCIKVDREERPDVDEHYMTATQVLSGQGGWPMSVFLTPDGRPFYAGTYFPPKPGHGRPSFAQLVEALSEAWRERRGEVEATATDVTGILQRLAGPRPPEQDVNLDAVSVGQLARRAAAGFDPQHGGFGGAPKFPRQTLLQLLLAAHAEFEADGLGFRKELKRTLDAMAAGGIHDHLTGAFHRYSTDAEWLVPHFEVMLYDQGLLAWVYAEAYRLFEDDVYARVARSVCDHVIGRMRHPAGPFFASTDAEADGREGSTFLWTPEEVVHILGEDDGRFFNDVYGLSAGPNFADPHGPSRVPDRNVLHRVSHYEAEDDARLAPLRRKLLAARNTRPQPTLDEKIVVGWNGLMIRGLAWCGETLDEPRFLAAAEQAADWILRHCRGRRAGSLLRTPGGPPAFLEDYAYLGRGLMALAHAGVGEGYRDHAAALAAGLRTNFEGPAGLFAAAEPGTDDAGILDAFPRVPLADSPTPAGNGSAAMLFAELGEPSVTRRIVSAAARQIVEHPGESCALLEATLHLVQTQGELAVRASHEPDHPDDVPSVHDEAERAVDMTVRRTGPLEVSVLLDVREPFHLAAPGADAVGRPLHVEADAARAVEYPAVVGGRYTGHVSVAVRLATPDTQTLRVRYQACDDTRCLPEVERQLPLPPAE